MCVYIYVYVCIYIYIYIYTHTYGGAANLRTRILDSRGFDSSIILILRGGILMSINEFPRNVESTNLSRDNLSSPME